MNVFVFFLSSLLQQAPLRAATYRMVRGCARRSRARSSWNLKGSFPRTCICRDSEESRSPRIWTCRRNRWKSGFRTAGWSTRRRAKPPRGARTAVASAQPATQTIQGQRTRSLYLRPLPRRRKRCHPSERKRDSQTSRCWHFIQVITQPPGQKQKLPHEAREENYSSLPVDPTF